MANEVGPAKRVLQGEVMPKCICGALPGYPHTLACNIQRLIGRRVTIVFVKPIHIIEGKATRHE